VTKTQAAAHHGHAIVVTYGYPFCSDCCCRCHRHRHRLGMRCAFLLFLLFLLFLFLFLFRPWTWGTASCCHRRLVSWVTWSDDACRRRYSYRRCEMIFVILLLPQGWGWGCVIAHAPPSPVPQLALTDLAALL
jgi:hypothetical protein